MPVYKYLGLSVDHNLTFKDHVELKLKQCNKRLYCVRQMKKNKVKKKLIEMFYNAMIPSVLLYACSGFLNLVTKTLKHDLDRPRRRCSKLIGDSENLVKPDIMYKNATLSLAAKIIKDQYHPLCSQYVLLPSGRRYRLPRIKTSRFRSTFVPSSIILMNEWSSIIIIVHLFILHCCMARQISCIHDNKADFMCYVKIYIIAFFNNKSLIRPN